MPKPITGGCLCGAVRYRCGGEALMMGHCHCEDCRRSSGTGHASLMAVPEDALALTGEVKGYDRPADSGNMVTRAFCPTCGSWIYSKNVAMPGMIFFTAGSLDDLEIFQPQMHVYRMRAASWDAPSEGVPMFDRMPPGM